MQLRHGPALLAIVLALSAGCGKSAPSSVSPAVAPTSSPAKPSETTKMICASEAQDDIAKAVGVRTTKPVTATWANTVYSCPYVYAGGTMTLSVKQLPDAKATGRYFDKLAKDLGKVPDVFLAFGDESILTTNGSVVVRKDSMVLLVDVKALPPKLGRPPATPSVAARTVARTIMGCWVGEH